MPKPATSDRTETKTIMEAAILSDQFNSTSQLWLAAAFLFFLATVAAIVMGRYDASTGAIMAAIASWTIHLFVKEKAMSLKRE